MGLCPQVAWHLENIDRVESQELRSRWLVIDSIIRAFPEEDQILQWIQTVSVIKDIPVSKGHPYFLLGVLHLLKDSDHTQAVDFLEKAYHEDKIYGPDSGRTAHRMSAYRLLAFVKGYFDYVKAKVIAGKPNWETEQFEGAHRRNQIETLLTAFDRGLFHPLDVDGHTYQSFFRLIKDKDLCRFAIENYFCADELINLLITEMPSSLRTQHEYAMSRAIISLLAGVLEAILSDRLPTARGLTLGGLIREAYVTGVIGKGSRLAALSSLMLYFRNHFHADRDAQRSAYFIDLNVARGCKASLDWALSEML